MISSPIFTPINESIISLETQPIQSPIFTLINEQLLFYFVLIFYLISSIVCLIYLLVFKASYMSFKEKILLSLIAPLVFYSIFIKKILELIASAIATLICDIIIYFLFQILIPFIHILRYLYNHTKIIWISLAKFISSICYIIFITGKFVYKYIIYPILYKIIFPICRYIASFRAFQKVINYLYTNIIFFINEYPILFYLIFRIILKKFIYFIFQR